MSASYSYPGIYVQELPSSSHAIVPAPTSIAAFVGYSHPFKTQSFNTAQEIFSFNDYVTYFGPLFSSGVIDASLPRAVYQFFLNGGSSAWVVGLQPGLFDEDGDIITRLGAAGGGATITGATSGGTSAAVPVTIFTDSITPALASVSPGSISLGDAFTLRLQGNDFDSNATVVLTGPAPTTNQIIETPSSVAPNSIAVSVSAPTITLAGTYSVTVLNSPTGTPSNALNFTVNANDLVPIVNSVSLVALYNALGTGGGTDAGKVPALTAITPGFPTVPVLSLPAGSSDVTLVVSGANFVPAASVTWNSGPPVGMEFLSDSQLAVTVAVPHTVPSSGSVTLSVSTGAGHSNDFSVPIASATPTPQITSVTPGSITAGDGGFLLIVTGSDFVPGATLQWTNSGSPSTPPPPAITTITPGQISAPIPATYLTAAGTVSLRVTNPGAAAPSNTVTLAIRGSDLTPTIASLSPAAVQAGSSSATVIVSGSNFVPSTTANWNLATPVTPAPNPPTVFYISDTELELSFGDPAAIANHGIAYLSLTNTSGPGLVFTALELTDIVPMTVTITNVRAGGTFDAVITYGNRVETYRGLMLAGKPGQSPDRVINGISQLVTVAPAAGGYGGAVAAQQFELVYDFPANMSTGFSAADFTEGEAPALGVFEANGPLDNIEIFNLLLIPGVGDFSVQSAALAFAERKRAFLIMDAPLQAPAFGSSNATPQPVQSWMDGLNGDAGAALPRSQNGAVYFPYLISNDPVTSDNIPMAPSGFVAGVYAQTDNSRGVWKAPAGLAALVQNTSGPVLPGIMNDPQQGVLNLDAINCLRAFSGIGTVIWGSRTLVAQSPAFQQWMYVPVRRMTLFIEQTLLANLRWVVFEPNDEPLWIAITQSINSFMLSLFRQGALQGETPSEAFQVKCDATTTTPADQATGIVNIVVAFAPLKPAEFVVIQIAQLAGQTAGS
jgi:phage tail sheath protein FI